jgi:hypothetical protein
MGVAQENRPMKSKGDEIFMKKVTPKKKQESGTAKRASLPPDNFDVLNARDKLNAERKKEFDRPVIEYQRGMGNAPKRLERKLKHLDTIGPSVRALAGQMLAKYPEPPTYEALGVKNAVMRLFMSGIGMCPPWSKPIGSGSKVVPACWTLRTSPSVSPLWKPKSRLK